MDLGTVLERHKKQRREQVMIYHNLYNSYQLAIIQEDYDSLVSFYDELTMLAKSLQYLSNITPYDVQSGSPFITEDENSINAVYEETLTVHDQLYEVYALIQLVQNMLYRAVRFNN